MINFGEDVSAYIPVWAAGIVLAIIGKVCRRETASLLLGLSFAVIAPSAASLLAAAVFTLVLKGLDFLHLWRS